LNPERWKKVEEVFDAVLDRAPAERPAFLAGVCAGDQSLRHDVETLIRSYEAAGTFMDAPILGPGVELERTTDPGPGPSSIGRRIGSYRLTKEIGRGGMGAVYLAIRADDEFQKRVAIKLVKRGMDTDFILRRFRQERQILASLDHPYIARLLDGGTTDDGLPYFVMEYIEGLPLTNYCDTQCLSTTDRLKLFLKVCSAVQHAHQNLVIHRDLKPSNVLVTDEATPKLLDFGIAKLLNPELGAQTLDPTTLAMRLMTPEYASPEQVRGDSVALTSDIYSLGVLLYELLTGHRPYRLRNHTTEELARVICEQEPERPSIVIDLVETVPTKGPRPIEITPESVALLRADSTEKLRRQLSGSVDNVVLKALRKEPHRRYQSADELAEDLDRCLAGTPVLAPAFLPSVASPRLEISESPTGPRSIAILPFRTLKSEDSSDEYLGMGMADALITKLSNIRRIVVRPTSSIIKYFEGEQNAVVAGNELNVDFVLDGRVQRMSGRVRVTVQLVRVRDGAPLWAEKFDEKFTDIFSVEDSISEKVAQALMPRLSGEEIELLRKRETDNTEAYQCYLQGRFFWNKFTEDGFGRALELFNQAVHLDPEYALAYVGLADYFNWAAIFGIGPPREYFPQARAAALKALELDESLAEAHAAYAFTMLCYDWDISGAEHRFRIAIELNPNSALAHQWYANLLTAQGRFDEAIAEVKNAQALNPFSLMDRSMTGWTYYQARQYDLATQELEQVLELDRNFGHATMILGTTLAHRGHYDRAISTLRRAIDLLDGSIVSLWMLGYTLAIANKRTEALAILNRLKLLSEEIYVSPYSIAMVYVGLGEKDLAFDWLEKAFQDRDEWLIWLGTEPKLDTLRSDARFGDLLQRVGIKGKQPELVDRVAQHDSLFVGTGGTKGNNGLQGVKQETLLSGDQPELVRDKDTDSSASIDLVASDNPRKSSKVSVPFYLAGFLVLIILVAFAVYQMRTAAHVAFLDNTRAVKLTTNGTARTAAFSRDGKHIVYTVEEAGKQSLWVRQLSAQTPIRLLPPSEVDYKGAVFTSDGANIIYASSPKTGRGALYKMPASGGTSTKIIDDVDSAAGVSSDGEFFAFVRSGASHGEDYLFVCNQNGTAQRPVAVRKFPRHFSVSSAPSWSPDGKIVTVVVEDSDKVGFFMSLLNVHLKEGTESIIGSDRMLRIGQTAWVSDGSGIVMTSQLQNSSFEQLQFVSYPLGVVRTLTTDTSDYSGASLPSDSSQLVAIQTQTLTNVWLSQRDALDRATQLTPGVGRYFDISWAPDGKILYSSDASGTADIWEMAADGSDHRQLTFGVGRNYAPAVSPDGRYVVFHSTRSGNWQIWRMNRDGGNVVQVTTGTDDSNWPQVTPDGRWIIYEHVGGGSLASIWRAPIDGGPPVRLSAELAMRPAISPDGQYVAFWQKDQTPGAVWRIAVVQLPEGTYHKSFDVPQSPANGNTNLRWTPDGKSIVYIDYREGTTSFWNQPLNAGATQKINEFTNNQIYAFDIAQDGRYIFSRGLYTNDVVVISDAHR